MICPACKSEGRTSKVYPGLTETTCLGYTPFYDEEGRFHDHDPNRRRSRMRCSNGHSWPETYRAKCWCGWPEPKREIDAGKLAAEAKAWDEGGKAPKGWKP